MKYCSGSGDFPDASDVPCYDIPADKMYEWHVYPDRVEVNLQRADVQTKPNGVYVRPDTTETYRLTYATISEMATLSAGATPMDEPERDYYLKQIEKLETQVDNHSQVVAEFARLLDNVRSVLDNPAEVTDEFRLERIDIIVNGEKNGQI